MQRGLNTASKDLSETSRLDTRHMHQFTLTHCNSLQLKASILENRKLFDSASYVNGESTPKISNHSHSDRNAENQKVDKRVSTKSFYPFHFVLHDRKLQMHASRSSSSSKANPPANARTSRSVDQASSSSE